MTDVFIKPALRLSGQITVPGDKSISHRALLLSAVASGRTVVTGLATAADVQSTRVCLEDLGVPITTQGDEIIIDGVGSTGLKPASQALNAGNSGTTVRLLSGILAGQNFATTITGDDSLRKRPMKRIIEPLEKMGAIVESQQGFPPLTIHGSDLRTIEYNMPIASAQVKSCILLAGMYAKGTTTICEPAQSRDHTERMLQEFGVHLKCNNLSVSMDGPVELSGCKIFVPGDISSAAFFLVAGLVIPQSLITIYNLGLNPTRTGILHALDLMGAQLKVEMSQSRGEPRGKVIVESQSLHSVEIAGEMIPRIIDEIPILAVAATQAQGTTIVTDAKELRVKETDRIAATCTNLRRMGVAVQEHDDGFTITGPCRLKGAEVDSFGDHRIAMAFAIAALLAEGETKIKNADCVDISYPEFFKVLDSLRRARHF